MTVVQPPEPSHVDGAGLQRPDTAAFSGRGLQGRLVEHLGPRIVDGSLPPGQVIDLDQFATEEHVSRTVVREAVKVLVGKGLLDARPKHGTFVRDRANWSLLDPEVMRWRCVEGPDPQLLRELMEIRLMLEPGIARLAALRRSQTHVAAMRDALDVMASPQRSVEDHVEADLRFHWLLASASGNELLEQLSNMLQPAQRSRDLLAFEHLTHGDTFLQAHGRVLDQVEASNADGAEAAMRALVEDAREDIEAILSSERARGRHEA